jgi:hypothetical protein
MNFTEYIQSEEYKLFPTGKVENQIKKAKEENKSKTHGEGSARNKRAGHRAHVMTAVKNFKSKADKVGTVKSEGGMGAHFHASEGEYNKDKGQQHNQKAWKSVEKREKQGKKARKAADKGDGEKERKHGDKYDKHNEDVIKHSKRAQGMGAVRRSWQRTPTRDDEKQAEHNKNVKSLKRSMKKTDNREKLEKTSKKKSPLEGKRDTADSKGNFKAKGPRIKNIIKKKTKKESMDFTDFLNHQVDPLYEVKGEMPKCPPGYKWNPKTMRCEPKTAKDEVGGPRNQKSPYGQWFYNVIGSSGYDGGWAFEEPPTPGTEQPGT